MSLSVRPENPDDPIEQFRDSFDTMKQQEARRRAIDTAIARIKAAHAAGAHLYLRTLDPEDFGPVIEHTPETIDNWIEGADGPTTDFKRRVRWQRASI